MRPLRALLTLMVPLAAWAGQAGHLTLARAADLAHPRLEPAHAVEGLAVQIGHAVLHLDLGKAALVTLDGRPLGFCFEGEGTLDYASDQSWDVATFATNTRMNTSLSTAPSPGGGLSIKVPFKQALVWSLGGPKAFSGSPLTEGLDAAFGDLLDTFRKTDFTSVEAELLDQSENPARAPWLRADLLGGPLPAVYEYDPSRSRMEHLYALKREASNLPGRGGWLDPIELSTQPIGWDVRDPVGGACALTAVDVDLRETEPASGLLQVRETLIPTTELRLVRLNLDRHTYDQIGWKGSAPEEVLSEVLDEQGKPLPFRQDEGEVLVELPAPVKAGTPVRLSFKIQGNFLPRRNNDSYWQLGTWAWFPQPDLDGQIYTWHAIVRVRSPWQAFSCGDTVRRWDEDGIHAVETRSELPIAFGVIQAGTYQVHRETRNGLTVEVASYGGASKSAKTLADIAFYAIARYQTFLGAYPYKEFHILEMKEWGYGQAPPTIMFITQEAFSQIFDETNRAFSEDLRHRFLHEIAHQWWGIVVKMPNAEEQWLTESFADISSAILLSTWPKGRAEGEYKKLLAFWQAKAEEASPKASIPAANRLRSPNGMEAYLTRTYLLYAKGPWLLQQIREEVGEQAFLTFLKSYQATFKGRFGTTRDVAGLLTYLTKKDWAPWFEANYWGTGLPPAHGKTEGSASGKGP